MEERAKVTRKLKVEKESLEVCVGIRATRGKPPGQVQRMSAATLMHVGTIVTWVQICG